MALPNFEFTKTWNSAEDFPSYESDEAQVRADMQYLYDELLRYLNQLSEAVVAGAIPFEPTAEVDASDIQNAIAVVQSQIAGIALGDIPDGSLTNSKYANGSISNEKLMDGTLETEKFADGAVETEKLADGAVTNEKIAEATIEADRLAGGLTRELFADGVFADFATLRSGKLTPTQRSLAWASVGASRELTVDDEGKILYVNSSGAVTITIPLNSTAALPIGTEIEVYRRGSGDVNITAAEGVTLLKANATNAGLKSFERLRLKKWDANTWSLEGRLPDNSVNTVHIIDAAITAAKIAASAVTTEKLADSAVTNGKIANGAVTAPKIGYGTSLPSSGTVGQIYLLKV